MAEIVDVGDFQVIVKDWEKLLSTYKAELVRVNCDGDVELLIDNTWIDIAAIDV